MRELALQFTQSKSHIPFAYLDLKRSFGRNILSNFASISIFSQKKKMAVKRVRENEKSNVSESKKKPRGPFLR